MVSDDEDFHSDYSAFEGSSVTSPGLLTSDDEATPASFRKPAIFRHPPSALALPPQPSLFGRRKQRRFENDFFFFNGMDSFWDANPVLHALCADFERITLQEKLDENPFEQFKVKSPAMFDRFMDGELDVDLDSVNKTISKKKQHRNNSLSQVDRKIRPHLLKACGSTLVESFESVLLSGDEISAATTKADFTCQRVVDEAGEVWLHFAFSDFLQSKIAMGVAQYYGLAFQCDRQGKVKLKLAELVQHKCGNGANRRPNRLKQLKD